MGDAPYVLEVRWASSLDKSASMFPISGALIAQVQLGGNHMVSIGNAPSQALGQPSHPGLGANILTTRPRLLESPRQRQ